MQTITDRLLRSLGHGLVPATALAGAAALLLSGCQSDSAVSNNTEAPPAAPRSFSLVAGADGAARLAANQLLRPWATIDKRNPTHAGALNLDPPVVASPFDLTYLGGATVRRATSWNLYVNCAAGPADCWGTGNLTPGTFLRDLNRSPFIRVVNQYLGVDALNNFRVDELGITGVPFAPSLGNTPTASINDIFSLIYSAVAFTGQSGYGNMYHVFLPEGTDMCITGGVCYSPDDFSQFVFCAFHGSVDLPDPANPGGSVHVLFSVEPFQYVPGCALPGETPHGTIDATASTLSHEFFETITDPDLDAWFNFLTGEEVADLCSAFASNERMNGHAYSIQLEYSNRLHACTNRS